jgi:hypothetical protein
VRRWLRERPLPAAGLRDGVRRRGVVWHIRLREGHRHRDVHEHRRALLLSVERMLVMVVRAVAWRRARERESRKRGSMLVPQPVVKRARRLGRRGRAHRAVGVDGRRRRRGRLGLVVRAAVVVRRRGAVQGRVVYIGIPRAAATRGRRRRWLSRRRSWRMQIRAGVAAAAGAEQPIPTGSR